MNIHVRVLNISVVARGWGQEERGLTANGYRVSFVDAEKVLEIDTDGSCTS